MTVTKADKIRIISEILSNNSSLPDALFDSNGNMHTYVRDKLLNNITFILKTYAPYLSQSDILDIFLSGSVCSYISNKGSDIDLFVVIKDGAYNRNKLSQKAFMCVSMFINLWVKSKIHAHAVDFSITHEDKYCHIGEHTLAGYSTYSILHNRWHSKPVKRDFGFTAEELYQHYTKFNSEMMSYIKSLPKINDAFLTTEGAQQLEQKLSSLKTDAFLAKDVDPEHEYSLTYNIYRLAKKFGLLSHLKQYAADSYKYLASHGENNE